MKLNIWIFLVVLMSYILYSNHNNNISILYVWLMKATIALSDAWITSTSWPVEDRTHSSVNQMSRLLAAARVLLAAGAKMNHDKW